MEERRSPFIPILSLILAAAFVYGSYFIYNKWHEHYTNLKMYKQAGAVLSNSDPLIERLSIHAGSLINDHIYDSSTYIWRKKFIELRDTLSHLSTLNIPDSILNAHIYRVDSVSVRLNEAFVALSKSEPGIVTDDEVAPIISRSRIAHVFVHKALLRIDELNLSFGNSTAETWKQTRYFIGAVILLALFFTLALWKSYKDFKRRKSAEQSENQLYKQYREYKRDFEESPLMEFRIDPKGNIISVNRAVLEFYQTSDDEMHQSSFYDLYPDSVRQHIKDKIELCLNNFGKPVNWEMKKLRPNGDIFWVKEFGRATEDSKGRPIILVDSEDTTETKIIHEKNVLNEEILNTVASLILVVDSDSKIKYVSPSVKKILGYEQNEVLGNGWWEKTWYNEDEKDKEQQYAKKRAGGIASVATKPYERIIKRKDGSPCWILWLEAKGPSDLLIGVGHDITEIKEKEKALEDTEGRYRSLFNALGDSIFIHDPSGNIIEVNEATYKLLGYTRDELLEMDFQDISTTQLHLDLKDTHLQLRKGEQILNEGKLKNKNGEPIDVELSSSMIKHEDRRHILSIVRDITQRKIDEHQIRMLSSAIEQSPASVLITDVDAKIIYINPQFVKQTGYTFDEAYGKKPSLLKSGKTPDSDYKELWNTILGGNAWHGELLNKKKNGDLFWENVSISPLKNTEGKITHYISVKEDITDKKHAEVELREAKEKAEEMNRLKSIFLANMSHEFRTPMIGIIGYADILIEELEDPESKNLAENIANSGRRLTDTLNSVLDLTKIESGEFEIATQETDLLPIVRSIIKDLEEKAILKNVDLILKEENKKALAMVDSRLIRDAIYNVADNAIKFSEKNKVEIRVYEETIKNKNYQIIKVNDKGIGIPQEHLDTIFQPFRQVSEGDNRTHEGAGLGLTLAKNFIEAMDGKLGIKSVPGTGTSVTIVLPSV